jgi:uncharacterized membrane protein
LHEKIRLMIFADIVFSGRAWWFPAVAALALLACALVWNGHRSAASNRVRFGCGLLKFAGVLALALCLLEPLWVGQRAKPGANLFALIADNSQSLRTVRDPGETESRGGILRRELRAGAATWESTLEQTFQVRRYLFDSRLENTRDFGELNFEGRATSLIHVLETLRERWRGQAVAGVLLFTDGNATDLPRELPALEGCPPVYPVLIGKDSGLRDIALDRVSVSQTAFEDAPVTVQAEVSAPGFAGNDVVVRLTEVASSDSASATNPAQSDFRVTGASNVVAQLAHRAGGDADLNFRFQFQPGGPGIHFYQLEARTREELEKPQAGSRELTLVNNRRLIAVDRGQEPIRVLYVGGRPNWEYKFLNRAIQEDSQVRMVSLIRVARREPKFEFRGRPGESSNPLFRGSGQQDEATARYDQPVLVRLNTQDAFELRGGFPRTADELFRYQAVILDHVEAEFFTHDQLALLQRFVSERGGGFLMLGGAESFREGDYAGTPVASLLPVYLDRPVAAALPGEWKLTLTRDGWLQPWTRLRSTEVEEKERLASMPPFELLNPVSAIKPGASVLATVSDANDRTSPALVAQRFGLGRSAALMIADLWRWGMRDENAQKDLAKSWRQLVRWLVADVPARCSIAPQLSYNGNPAEIRLTVKVRDPEFKPLDNATVRLAIAPVRLLNATNEGAVAASETNAIDITADASTTQPGTYEATYIARDAGAYSVKALVSDANGKVLGRAASAWSCDPEAEEFRSLKPNRALLETIARRTGGEMVSLENLENFARQLPKRPAPVTEPWSDPLWQRPAVLLFVLACFVTEWGIRRWKGLP